MRLDLATTQTDRAPYHSARFRVAILPGAWRVQELRTGREHIERRPPVLAALARAMTHCAGREAPQDVAAADKLLSCLFADPPPWRPGGSDD